MVVTPLVQMPSLIPCWDTGEGGEGISPGAAAVDFRRLFQSVIFQNRIDRARMEGLVFPDGGEAGFPRRLDGGQFTP